MRNVRPNCLFGVAVLVSALAPAAARADDALTVTSAQVTVNCPLTIGGSFDAKTSALTGSITPDATGAVKGTFAVDLIKLETGISLRDRHLRNNYLEIQKGAEFAVAKFENMKIQKLSGKTTFSGTMTLHGQQHDVSGSAELLQDGKGYKVDATFPLKISAFQIPEPTYLGVGVSDDISIHVVLTAAPAAAPRATTNGQSGTR